MILNSLELLNFKRYKEVEFNFNLGLTGLIGKNGSGKSTIFEAIIFALYGECNTPKELLKNSNAGAKEPLSVKLYFEIDGKEYCVVRELRGKALSAKANLYDANGELIASSAKGVNQEIVKLIGMTKLLFTNTVYASQKELTALSNLKSEERKKIIRRLLGLEKIDKIEKELIYKIRELNRDIKSFEQVLLSQDEIENLNRELKALEVLQKELKESIKKLEKSLQAQENSVKLALQEVEKWQKLKDDYNALNSALELLKNSLQNSKKSLQQNQQELKKLQNEESFYKENKNSIPEYKNLTNLIKQCQILKEKMLKKEGLEREQKRFREQLKSLKKELKNFNTELTQKEQLINSKKILEQNLEKYKTNLKTIENQERELLNERSKHQAIISNTKVQLDKITKLGKTSNCPTCTRPLLNEYEGVVSSLSATIESITKNQLNSVNISLQKLNNQKEQLQNSIRDKESELKTIFAKVELLKNIKKQLEIKQKEHDNILQKGLQNKKELESLQNIKYDSKKHQELLKKQQELEPKYNKLIGIARVIEQIPKLQEQIEKITQNVTKQEKDIKVQEEKLKVHKYSKESEESAKKSYQEALKDKESIQSQKSAKVVELTKAEANYQNIQKQLEQNNRHKERLNNLIQERDDLDVLKLILIDFKTKINSKITPRISQLASSMFAEVTKGRYQLIEVDDDFNFFIYDESQKFPIERFSGGEIDLANLVLRIAISKTVNELNSNTNIGFLAFDEIFGSQDEERRYSIMESLNHIKEHYRQIFLVSHDREIKELFERVIEVS